MTDKKHMTKKELQEDPFFHEVAHVVDFYQKNKNAIHMVLLVILVAAAGVLVSGNISKKNTVAASGYFGIAMDNYNKGNLEQAEEYFLLTSQEFGKNTWGKKASYYLGLIHQDSEEGVAYLTEFVGSGCKEAVMKASAYQILAAKALSDGDMTAAGEHYLAAAKNAPDESLKTDYAVRAARAYAEAGDAAGIDTVLDAADQMGLEKENMDRVQAAAL